jgi:hypothetical protein
MRAKDAINVFITTGETTYDFTDGILNIDIVRGVDEYQSRCWSVSPFKSQ